MRLSFVIIIFFSQVLMGNDLHKIDSLKLNALEIDIESRIENYITLAELYRGINIDSTIRYGNLAVEQAKKIGNKEKEAFAIRSLGVTYFYTSDLDRAMYFFKQSLRVYQSINHELGISNCFNGIGKVYEQRMDLDSAEYFFNESLLLRLKLLDSIQIASSYVNIGNLFYYRNQLNIALEYYLKGLAITKELNIEDDVGDAYINIGIVYNKLNNFEKALIYLNDAETIFRNINNDRTLSIALLNKANIYNYQLKYYNEAISLYKASLEIKTRINEQYGIALIHNNIGTVYGNMEDYETALMYLKKAKQMHTELDNQAGLIMVNHNLGNVYFEQKKYTKAITHFTLSLDSALKTGFNDYITSNYKSLIQTYAAMGDYKNFVKYYNLDNHITDSLLSNLNQAQLNLVETKILADEINNENNILKKQVLKLNQTSKTRILIIFGLSSLFLLTIIIQIILQFVKKKNKQNLFYKN